VTSELQTKKTWLRTEFVGRLLRGGRSRSPGQGAVVLRSIKGISVAKGAFIATKARDTRVVSWN
jgi:hypothetical protein